MLLQGTLIAGGLIAFVFIAMAILGGIVLLKLCVDHMCSKSKGNK